MSAAILQWFRHRPEGLDETPLYGARELQRLHARHLLQSLTISCLLGMATALVLSQLSQRWAGITFEPPRPEAEEGKVDLFTPVSPGPPVTPSGSVSELGIPVAVTDALLDTARVASPPWDFSVQPLDDAPPGPPGFGPTGKVGSSPAPPPDPYAPVYVEEMPIEIARVTPEYPDLARRAGMEGRVLVRALVGIDGRVQEVLIHGSESVFDEAAVRAVQQWVFRPAQMNGQPVRVWVSVPITFRLR